MSKNFILILFMFFMTHTVVAYGAEYNTKQNGTETHKTHVDVGGSCCAFFNISTQVGHIQDGKCHFEAETQSTQTSICDVRDGIFTLDGGRLKQLIGSGWECAATHLTASIFGSTSDEFKLISDGSGNYVNSDPAMGNVSLKLCSH